MASHVRLGLVAVVTLPWYGKAGAASAFSKGSEPPAAEQRARPVPLTARAKTISTPWSTRLSQGSWFVGDEDTWAALHQVGHLTLKPAQGAAVQGRLSAKKLGEPRDWAVGAMMAVATHLQSETSRSAWNLTTVCSSSGNDPQGPHGIVACAEYLQHARESGGNPGNFRAWVKSITTRYGLSGETPLSQSAAYLHREFGPRIAWEFSFTDGQNQHVSLWLKKDFTQVAWASYTGPHTPPSESR